MVDFKENLLSPDEIETLKEGLMRSFTISAGRITHPEARMALAESVTAMLNVHNITPCLTKQDLLTVKEGLWETFKITSEQTRLENGVEGRIAQAMIANTLLNLNKAFVQLHESTDFAGGIKQDTPISSIPLQLRNPKKP